MINGARSLGLNRDLGSLEVGKSDMVVLNADPAGEHPQHDLDRLDGAERASVRRGHERGGSAAEGAGAVLVRGDRRGRGGGGDGHD